MLHASNKETVNAFRMGPSGLKGWGEYDPELTLGR